jgi:hypothetical protein
MSKRKDNYTDRFKEVVGNLDNLSDRHAAILVASYLEHHLDRLIVKFTKNNKDKIEKIIFSRLGRLNDKINFFDRKFVKKSDNSYIDKDMRKDMNKIRKIRNSFAHTQERASFSQNDIEQRCKSMENKKKSKDYESARQIFLDVSVKLLIETRIKITE